MGRGPGRAVARWAGWGAVVPCVVVLVLAVLAIASSNVPPGEVLAYAGVLAPILVPGGALAGAARGAAVVATRSGRAGRAGGAAGTVPD